MPTLLITGATGFVGQAVLQQLEQRGPAYGAVHCTRRDQQRPGSKTVAWHRVDLLATAAVSELLEACRPTHLLHLGWCSEHGQYWDSPLNLKWTCATLHLFAEFARTGGQRFVGVGTCAEYKPSDDAADELTTSVEPFSLYGAAKAATGLCICAGARSLGLSAAWARLFFPYGPGDQPGRLMPSVARALSAGTRIAVTAGGQLRDPLYVSDVADALLALLESPVEGAVNIASGTPRSVRDLVTRLAGLAGRPDLIEWGGRVPDEGGRASWIAAVARLRHEVGWQPRVSLDQGLRHLLDMGAD